MNGHNASFLANPKTYLRKNAVESYNVSGGKLADDMRNAGGSSAANTCGHAMEFDLVPQKGGYVSLCILGRVGTYGQTSRKGRPLVGRWIPYLGQKKVPDPSKFGSINLDAVAHTYVFTVGFTGCKFVAVQKSDGIHLFHEPTAESWGETKPDYGGEVIMEAGPDYSLSPFAGGLGVAVRQSSGWKMFVQTTQGVKVLKVEEFTL
jgi:hypothetical protein